MPSIIVPVDFSGPSSNAARYAADMALAIGAEIHLVHVLQMPAIPVEAGIPDYALDEMRDSALTSLQTLSDELVRQTGGKVSVATDLETGELNTRVKDFCRWKRPFLVVMDASLPSPIQQLPYAQLLIPEHTTFHPIREILLACDQEDIQSGMPVPVGFLRQLRDLLGARFDVIHVITDEEKEKGEAVPAFDKWKDVQQKSYPEMHFIGSPQVEEGVQQYLDDPDHMADWLMVFPKKNGLFHLHKSLSQKIILHCPVPVMSIHE